MSEYFCPLCKQEVSRSLYEKITGIWQEKEERLKEIKGREKKLLEKEKEMQTRFADEKKRIINSERQRREADLAKKEREWSRALDKERVALQKNKEAAERLYRRQLGIETNRIMRQEREKARELERTMRERFQHSANKLLEKEQKGLLRQRAALQKQEKVQMNKYKKLNEQYSSLQTKSRIAQERATKKIAALEEQLKKDSTPQVLGLLEEGIFLEKLKSEFPFDRYEHTGKGGDIVHRIMDRNVEVGTIVYELKKVSVFNRNHIAQAFEAKKKRNADYGILVTNAKRSKDDIGFSVVKGVIIIHPAGALVLVNIVREHLLRIAKLKLSAEKRRKTVQAVLEYIQGPTFRNGIEGIIEDTKELYLSLTKEVRDHIKNWGLRINKYRDIQSGAHIIDTRVVKLLDTEPGAKKGIIEAEIVPIALPPRID
jgi:hypothetical protein